MLNRHEILAVDIGSSSIKASIVLDDLQVGATWSTPIWPKTPIPNFVEYDGKEFIESAKAVISKGLTHSNSIDAISIANQRATTAVWRRSTGQCVGPILSWMDLRTAPLCIALAQNGLPIAPNQSVTKAAYLFSLVDPAEHDDLCFGTLDSYLIWHLTNGKSFVTDHTNAAMTGFIQETDLSWSTKVLSNVGINLGCLPKMLPSASHLGDATIDARTLPILGTIGDQQASLIGQGGFKPGDTKITFGTGTMLDQNQGKTPPPTTRRLENGTFPVVAYTHMDQVNWASEAIALGSGSIINWLVSTGIIKSLEDANNFDKNFRDTSRTYVVPASAGFGTPEWDFGARTSIQGLTLSTDRTALLAATLDGIAQIAADLVQATEKDTNLSINDLRVDGGMTLNENFLALVANATGLTLNISPMRESTTLGSAILALSQLNEVPIEDYSHQLQRGSVMLSPQIERESKEWIDRRERWKESKAKSLRSVPELSDVSF